MADLDLIRVLNRAETQKMVDLSDETWKRLEKQNDTPAKTQLSPGRIGYRVSDIIDWLNKRRVKVAA